MQLGDDTLSHTLNQCMLYVVYIKDVRRDKLSDTELTGVHIHQGSVI